MAKDPRVRDAGERATGPGERGAQGQKFYFRSTDCQAKFEQNPERYARQTA